MDVRRPRPYSSDRVRLWSSKVLLTAIEFDLFTTLGDRSLNGAQLGSALDLHPRGIRDFFDALVAMGFLERSGDGPAAQYRNTPATATYLNRSSPRYIGGILEMLNARLYRFWDDLPTALRTGNPRTKSSTAASRCSRNCTATYLAWSSSSER